MSDPGPRITIVGLGQIANSIGLALREREAASAIVGHDRDGKAASQAKKIGAVDKTDWNLLSACDRADLVILAIPAAEIEATLKAIGPELRPGCVVLDTASLKGPVLAWAAEHLPESVFFVGGNPITSRAGDGPGGFDQARADLFQGGTFCLAVAPGAEPGAIQLVTNLVAILGATPLFVDPAEHDGLMAGVEHLPGALALALLETVALQPTWRELRKVAGANFEASTRLGDGDPDSLAALYWANRSNLVRWIDAFAQSLASVRQELVADEPGQLADRLAKVEEERLKWLVDSMHGMWDRSAATEMPDKPNFFADAFLGGIWRKRAKRDE